MVKHRDLKIINNYAKHVILRDTKKLNKADWNIIGADIIPNERIKAFYTRKIVMSNLEIANKAILDLLLANDIAPSRGLTVLKEAEAIARRKENSADLIKIAKEYNLLNDLAPVKVQYSETRRISPDYEGLLPSKETVTKTISTTVNSENKQKEKD